jgi:predicted nucleotidyltransferase
MAAPMKNNEKLLEQLTELPNKIQTIQAIILFGSVARGQAREGSDVDICIVLKNESKKVTIEDQLLSLEKKYDTNINTILTTPQFKGLDRQFIETILREGKVLSGTFPEVPIQRLELEPYEIIKYDLSALTHSEKMKIKRLLYGVTTKKKYNGKTYENKQRGKVEEFNGIRIGIASILIPEKMSWHLEELLRKYKISLRKITIWLSKT